MCRRAVDRTAGSPLNNSWPKVGQSTLMMRSCACKRTTALHGSSMGCAALKSVGRSAARPSLGACKARRRWRDRSIRDARHSGKSSGVTRPLRLVGTRGAESILASGPLRPHSRPDIWAATDHPDSSFLEIGAVHIWSSHATGTEFFEPLQNEPSTTDEPLSAASAGSTERLSASS
jgi:hypothetical protein